MLTYVSAPLTAPLRLSGAPEVNLYASTSGSDSDWVVKLIDVYPDTVPSQPAMGGYELAISLDIFRGRYRTSFEHPEAITPNQPLLYRFGLPTVNHVFLPGHRIMVQVQSTLFPLYDRNPQTFRPQHFLRKARRLSKSHAAHLAHSRQSQLHQPAGRALDISTIMRSCGKQISISSPIKGRLRMNAMNRRDFMAAGIAAGVCSTGSGLAFPFPQGQTPLGQGSASMAPKWLGEEPIVVAGCWDEFPLFQLRAGHAPVLLEELYKKQSQEQTIKNLKDAGVTLGIIHFFKGFGLAAEQEHMADARLLSKRLKDNGIRVGLYVGASIAYETFLTEKPEAEEWFVPDFMGKPVYYYDQTFRKLVYFMHPGYREYIRRVVSLGVEHFNPDLIHFDNTALMAEIRVMQHPMATQDFRKYLAAKLTTAQLTGRFGFADVRHISCPYPETLVSQINDPVFQEFADFRCHLLASYFNEMTSLIRSLNPEVAVDCNPHSGISGINTIWDQGISYPGLSRQVDVMWTEEGDDPTVTPEGILVSNIRTYKEAAIWKKRVFCSVGGGAALGSSGDGLAMAEALAYNRQCLGHIGSFLDTPKLPSQSRAYIQFFHENFGLYRDVENVADVALLYSDSTMGWNNDRPAVSFILASQMLIQGRLPFDIIFGEHLQDLSKYRVLFLADQECLSEPEMDLIRNFVRNGGGLVATEHTSLYTNQRKRQPDFGLKDCFGVTAPTWTGSSVPEEILKMDPLRTEFGKGRVVYIPAIEPTIEKPPAVPMVSRYWKLARNNSQLVAATLWVMRGDPSTQTEPSLSPYVVMELLHQKTENKMVLHVVNYDFAHNPSIQDIPVSVTVPRASSVKSVQFLTPDGPKAKLLTHRMEGPVVHFIIPSLNTYSLAVMDIS